MAKLRKKLDVDMRRSARARRVRIDVHMDGRVVVTRPLRVSAASAQHFVSQKMSWIQKTLSALDAVRRSSGLRFPVQKKRLTPSEYRRSREQAHALVRARVAHFNQYYRAPVRRIFIRDQRTRWGSASQKGNLNFNWRIVLLPQPLADYLVVHELCHLREFNHSERFWHLVEETAPDYKVLRRQLRTLPL